MAYVAPEILLGRRQEEKTMQDSDKHDLRLCWHASRLAAMTVGESSRLRARRQKRHFCEIYKTAINVSITEGDSIMKLFKGVAVLISFITGLAWADGSILCTCTQSTVSFSPVHYTGDIYLDLLLQQISSKKIPDEKVRFK